LTKPIFDKGINKYNEYHNSEVHQNPIINGYFPSHKTYKEMAIARINKTLCAILMVFILTSAVSYYFVTANELTLNKYRKQTLALNDENVELQNKLDYLKSYYNVDKAMQKQHFLQKADNVLEVKASPVAVPFKVSGVSDISEQSNQARWSLGF